MTRKTGRTGRKPDQDPGKLLPSADGSVVVGKHPVMDALSLTPHRVDSVFLQQELRKDRGRIEALCREHGVRFTAVSKTQLDKVAGGAGHQGVAARLFLPGYSDPDELIASVADAPLPLILALDQVQDPGNVGVLARTLLALGGAGMAVPKNRSAFLGTGAMKSSAGALERLPVVQTVNLSRFLKTCSQQALFVYGAGTGEDTMPIYEADLRLPGVLVLGNEEKGIRPGVAKQCDMLLTIPMSGTIDSLNVAQAGAIIMGEIVRQRRDGIPGEKNSR